MITANVNVACAFLLNSIGNIVHFYAFNGTRHPKRTQYDNQIKYAINSEWHHLHMPAKTNNSNKRLFAHRDIGRRALVIVKHKRVNTKWFEMFSVLDCCWTLHEMTLLHLPIPMPKLKLMLINVSYIKNAHH